MRDVRVVAPDVRAVDGSVEIRRTTGGETGGGVSAPAVLQTFAIFALMRDTEKGWRIALQRAWQAPPDAADAPAG